MLKLFAMLSVVSCAQYEIHEPKKPYVYMDGEFHSENSEKLQCSEAKEKMKDYVCLHIDDFSSLIHKKIEDR